MYRSQVVFQGCYFKIISRNSPWGHSTAVLRLRCVCHPPEPACVVVDGRLRAPRTRRGRSRAVSKGAAGHLSWLSGALNGCRGRASGALTRLTLMANASSFQISGLIAVKGKFRPGSLTSEGKVWHSTTGVLGCNLANG